MAAFRRRRSHRRHGNGRPVERPENIEPEVAEGTGFEADSLRALVDSRAIVIVVLTTGERLRGRIRYYDRECFSLGAVTSGPNIFLRKNSVQYIYEE